MNPPRQKRNRSSLTRRNALRGLGLSLSLPWLESLAPVASAAAAAAARPSRMAFIFVPNGVHLPSWTPETEGYGFELPYTLKPLQPVLDDLLVISGLTHDKGRANGDGPGDHARSASVFLTGAQPRKTSGADIRSGISVDQAAAQAAGHATRFASLELGCESGRGAGSCDSGYSCAYSNSISWSSEATPLGKEINPRSTFERLFANGQSAEMDKSQELRLKLRKSVLDFVSEDANRLQKKLGVSDRQKLDQYLTGVREIERRMESASDSSTIETDVDYPTPEGIPEDYGQHIRLMCDMLVLAFQTDSTRISTMMFANAGSNRSYKQININDGHHELSHHGGDAKKQAKIRDINRFHIQQFSYLLQKMKATPDGEGNLLDHSTICYGSGLSDGNRHNNENLPVLLAGGGNGAIDTGRHLRARSETPMCNLFMSLLDHFGTPVDYIGDSTGQLPGLSL
jgi:hypothetical protein